MTRIQGVKVYIPETQFKRRWHIALLADIVMSQPLCERELPHRYYPSEQRPPEAKMCPDCLRVEPNLMPLESGS